MTDATNATPAGALVDPSVHQARRAARLLALHEEKPKAAQALELWLADMTYEQIARAIGWGHRSTAMRAVRAEARRQFGRDLTARRTELRGKINAQIDRIKRTFYARARQGDEKAALIYKGYIERQARLLGLDLDPRALDDPAGSDIPEAVWRAMLAAELQAGAERDAAEAQEAEFTEVASVPLGGSEAFEVQEDAPSEPPDVEEGGEAIADVDAPEGPKAPPPPSLGSTPLKLG